MQERQASVLRWLAHPATIDWLVAAGWTLATELEAALRYRAAPRTFAVSALAGLMLLGLFWWRRRPALAMASVGAAGAIGAVAGGGQANAPVFAIFLVSYALGAYAGWRQMLIGMVIPPLTVAFIDSLHPGPYPLPDAVAYFAVFEVGFPVVVGRLVRNRARLVQRLRMRRATLELERQLAAEAARSSERSGLAARLDALVVRGVDEIIGLSGEAENAPDGKAMAARIEECARTLLEQMREMLLELGSTGMGSPVQGDHPIEPEERRARIRPPATIRQLPWPFLLAATFFVAFELELAVRQLSQARAPLVLLAALAMAAPLGWCGRRPLAATAAALAAATLFSRLAVPLESLLVPVGLFLILPFCVAAFSDRAWALIGLAVCAAGLTAAFGLADVVMNGGLVSLGFWTAGLYVRDRVRLAAELDETNQQIAEERDARAMRAVRQERARVAREMHDVVGHTLTVVVLQAGAARRLWGADRASALSALRTVKAIALGGLADLLHSLRSLETEPRQFGRLDAIPAVIEMTKAAGLEVSLEMRAPEQALSPELEVAAYRVVQEALTNALKHSPKAQASVRVCCSDHALDLEILNPLHSPDQPSPTGGHGLRSMEARVVELGGALDWGPHDGLFRVHATLPVRA